jgi:putative SOS response-associated peptidase YedK
VPHWAVDKKRFGLKTYNARSETVAEKPSYRSAWRRRQFSLAIMQSFYEPCYESGKAVRWRIRRTDASPMAVASIFEHFVDPSTGTALWSFSMLTINAAQHPLMQHFHKPDDEKRSIVVLQDDQYQPWLQASTTQAQQLLRLAPADFLVAEAAPRPSKKG